MNSSMTTMYDSTIASRIKELLLEKLGIDDCEIPESAMFKKDLGMDSLDLYETIMEIEKEFKIAIPDEDAENLLTVGSLVQYIQKKNNQSNTLCGMT
jgi:acyl carrier protein